MLKYCQMQQHKKLELTFQKQETPASPTNISTSPFIFQCAIISLKFIISSEVLQRQGIIGNRAVGRLSVIGNLSYTAQQTPVQRQEMPEEEQLQGQIIQAIRQQTMTAGEKYFQGISEAILGRVTSTRIIYPLSSEIKKTGVPDNLKSGLKQSLETDLSDIGCSVTQVSLKWSGRWSIFRAQISY